MNRDSEVWIERRVAWARAKSAGRQAVGRIGGLVRSSRHDGREMTQKARAAGPGSDDYWLQRMPAEGLDPEEPPPSCESAQERLLGEARLLPPLWTRRGDTERAVIARERVVAEARLLADRERQGLPRCVEDPAVLARVAAIVKAATR